MKVLWIVLCIIAALTVGLFILTGIAFVSGLRRPRANKKPKETVDLSKVFPSYDLFRDKMEAGKTWFLAQPRRTLTMTADDGALLYADVLEADPAVPFAGTVLLMHGYRGSPTGDFGAVFRFYHTHGYHIVVPDERACERSGGKYITLGVRESTDCLRWTEKIVSLYGAGTPLLLDGISMGATTVLLATALPLPPNVFAVIADCGFTSPRAVVRAVLRQTHMLPVFPCLPMAGFFTRVFAGFSLSARSTLDAMKTCKIPVFFAHGTGDRFVPHEMTVENFNACAAEKELFLVDGAEHGMSYIVKQNEYEQRVLVFLKLALIAWKEAQA